MVTHLNVLNDLFEGSPPPRVTQYLGGPVGPYCVVQKNGKYILEPSSGNSAKIYFLRTAKGSPAVTHSKSFEESPVTQKGDPPPLLTG